MRGTPIIYFKSLTRPIYIMGVSRELFYGNMGLAVFIAYSSHFAVCFFRLNILTRFFTLIVLFCRILFLDVTLYTLCQ